jgi:hypothetical protein
VGFNTQVYISGWVSSGAGHPERVGAGGLGETLQEETEPDKGVAKGAHGLVRLAPDVRKA